MIPAKPQPVVPSVPFSIDGEWGFIPGFGPKDQTGDSMQFQVRMNGDDIIIVRNPQWNGDHHVLHQAISKVVTWGRPSCPTILFDAKGSVFPDGDEHLITALCGVLVIVGLFAAQGVSFHVACLPLVVMRCMHSVNITIQGGPRIHATMADATKAIRENNPTATSLRQAKSGGSLRMTMGRGRPVRRSVPRS